MSQMISDARAGGGMITAVVGGNNITVNTIAGVATVNVSGTTNHAVQVGNALGALTSLALGVAGQVLTSNGPGLDPSFQATGLGSLNFDGNTGTANPLLNTIVFVTANATPIFVAAGNTLTVEFNLANVVLGSSLPVRTTGLRNIGIGSLVMDSLTSGSDNIAIGDTALGVITTANRNIAIGTDALGNNNALGNTAIGYQSLLANTTGIDNIGIGPVTLSSNISGGENIAIGTSAMITNTVGNNNIAIGAGSLGASNSNDNIGIGFQAGQGITSGIQHTFVGTQSGATGALTGSQNVGIGYRALRAITGAASDNTFVGGGAGELLTTSNSNTGMGNASLAVLTTGTSNTGLGAGSLTALTTTSFNTALGTGALDALTTGASNIAVGFNAGNTYTTNESNNIVIGNVGVVTDSARIRIGTNATHTSTFIAGIDGVNLASANVVTEVGDQLGTAIITAGTNVTVTPGANTITIAALGGGAVAWSIITLDQTAAVNNGYFCNKGSTLALALPATSAIGDVIEVVNINVIAGTRITQAAGQRIFIGNTSTTLGAGGSLTSTALGDSLKLVCRTANTIWQVVSMMGNWTVV